MRTVYGIADTNGLDALYEAENTAERLRKSEDKRRVMAELEDVEYRTPEEFGVLRSMVLRAQFNTQRFPVVFQARLKNDDFDMVLGLFNESKCEEALVLLKDLYTEVWIESGSAKKRMWEKNPFDPLA